MAQTKASDLIPTTYVTNPQQISQLNIDENLKNILVAQSRYLNTLALAINRKKSGGNYLQEFITGEVFFPSPSLSSSTPQTPTLRPSIKLVVDFGALPNATTKSVAHGIIFDTTTLLVGLESNATYSDGSSMIPIPYASPTLNKNIEIQITSTNVVITTAINYSNYTSCYVVIEYITR